MYRIEIEAEADKALRRMPRNTAKRIQSKLLDILNGASPVRAWREHRGLSQSQLAAAAGVDVDELLAIEDGTRKPTAATLRKLAMALRAHVDDLRA